MKNMNGPVSQSERRLSLRLWIVTFSWLFILSAPTVHADDDRDTTSHIISSGAQQTVLIELYTSEGCSSCPPAEAYLNGLKDDPGLWREYIPLAFHVDYWDYLGWQDPYAKASYTQRQRRYARHHRARTVYTPAFFVNGEPWRNSSPDDRPSVERAVVGPLRLKLDAGRVMLKFEPANPTEEALTFNVAILGMGLESSIKAGERAGGHARHEFVVLERLSYSSRELHWQTALPKIKAQSASAFAVVAWVSRAGSPVPLQATGGYIPRQWLD